MNKINFIKAREGKVFRRLSDKRVFGSELCLGMAHSLGNIQLQHPIQEMPGDYEEVDDGTASATEDVVLWDKDTLVVNSLPIVEVQLKTYSNIKKAIISSKYSLDEQMAIICNKDDGRKKSIVNYIQMQQWRSIAASIASSAVKKANK